MMSPEEKQRCLDAVTWLDGFLHGVVPEMMKPKGDVIPAPLQRIRALQYFVKSSQTEKKES